MPKDDWSKQARKQVGQRALFTGDYERAGEYAEQILDPVPIKPTKRKKKPRRKPREASGAVPEFTADTLPPWSQRPLVIVLRGPYPEKHPAPRFP